MSLGEEFDKMGLTNVAKGAAQELFDHAAKEVLLNCMDENRSVKKKRSIVLKFDFLPSQDRNSASVEVTCQTKLADVEGIGSVIYTRIKNGKPEAFVHDVTQPDLGFDNVAPINKGESNA